MEDGEGGWREERTWRLWKTTVGVSGRMIVRDQDGERGESLGLQEEGDDIGKK